MSNRRIQDERGTTWDIWDVLPGDVLAGSYDRRSGDRPRVSHTAIDTDSAARIGERLAVLPVGGRTASIHANSRRLVRLFGQRASRACYESATRVAPIVRNATKTVDRRVAKAPHSHASRRANADGAVPERRSDSEVDRLTWRDRSPLRLTPAHCRRSAWRRFANHAIASDAFNVKLRVLFPVTVPNRVARPSLTAYTSMSEKFSFVHREANGRRRRQVARRLTGA